MKPTALLQRPLTEEEKKDQMMRAFIHKKAAIAEGVLFNMVKGLNFIPDSSDVKYIVKACNELSDEFMKRVYDMELTPKDKEE